MNREDLVVGRHYRVLPCSGWSPEYHDKIVVYSFFDDDDVPFGFIFKTNCLIDGRTVWSSREAAESLIPVYPDGSRMFLATEYSESVMDFLDG